MNEEELAQLADKITPDELAQLVELKRGKLINGLNTLDKQLQRVGNAKPRGRPRGSATRTVHPNQSKKIIPGK